jgi:hypothetical protein
LAVDVCVGPDVALALAVQLVQHETNFSFLLSESMDIDY